MWKDIYCQRIFLDNLFDVIVEKEINIAEVSYK